MESVRAAAFLSGADDPRFDSRWVGGGGYGSGRIAEDVVSRLGPVARGKRYVGYSDAGFLMAGLCGAGFAKVAHGPMPQDVKREGGEAAVHRSLSWLVDRSTGALDPSVEENTRHAAFTITVFSQLLDTPPHTDLPGPVRILEVVSEPTLTVSGSGWERGWHFV